MVKAKDILVLGAGVSGLSCAIVLQEQGFRTQIWAKELSPNTTSDKAAAVWYPFIVSPPDKAARWAGKTLDFFLEKIIKDRSSGVYTIPVTEIFTKKKQDPGWKNFVKTFRRLSVKELPEGYIDGWAVEGVGMVTGIYMKYLMKKYKKFGGKIKIKEVTKIEETLHDFDIVVNCTGLGSLELLNDNELFPSRGQTVKIRHNGFNRSVFEEEGPNSLAYIIPRKNDIVLGGTDQKNNWNLSVSETDTKEILEKCAAISPEFRKVEVLGFVVGLRPGRSKIRLETENFGKNKFVVHNYGHGGSGFTLSWGCALEVARIIKDLNF